MSKLHPLILAGAVIAVSATAAEKDVTFVEHNSLMDHGGGHMMDMDGGMVMGQNKEQLPPGCDRISGDEEITVHAGHKYAKDFPGTMFGFSEHEWRVKPCTRLTVHFINEDHVRHQWMMHGLPKFIYDKGMFHLEMTGPAKISGTLILPAEDRTYLVHCDIAQHMEKGMKGQLIVGKGSTPFPSIPGITDLAIPDNYGPPAAGAPKPAAGAVALTAKPAVAPVGGNSNSGIFVLGVLMGLVGTPFALAAWRERFKGMSGGEIVAYFAEIAKRGVDLVLGVVAQIKNRFGHR